MALLQHSLCVVKRVFPRHKTVTKRTSSTAANSTLGVLGGTISVTALLQAQPRRPAHDPARPTGPMTEDEYFMFECCGYLIIEDVLTQEEIDEALAASKRIHANTTDVFSPLGNAYESEPALARLIDHPAVIPKVRGLYGDRFVMQSGWCARLVANGSIVGWHQTAPAPTVSKKLLIHCPYCNCAPASA